MGAKFALRDSLEERAHFIFLSFNLKFHSAVKQVAHPTGDVETLGYVSDRPAKADTLDVALVKYLERDHTVRPGMTLTKTRRRESLARRNARPTQKVNPGLTYKSRQDRSSPPVHQSDRPKRNTGLCWLEPTHRQLFRLNYNPPSSSA